MAKIRRIHDLSERDIRRLLISKKSESRKRRLEEFRRTGRIVPDTWIKAQPASNSVPNLIFNERPDSIRKSLGAQVADRFLLFVEGGAIISLLLILILGMKALGSLNQKSASVLVLPELTPTPLIRAVVLPSGHTPPTSPGGAQPNNEEIPEHLRPYAQALENIPIPTPSPEQAVRIRIPAIQIDAPIVQGDGWEQLKRGVGQHIGSGLPGKNGNIVLSAHNDVYGELIRHLDKLNPGDEIIVYSNVREYVYIVSGTQVVEPTYVQVMESTPHPTITLISCYPYLINTERIIVSGELES